MESDRSFQEEFYDLGALGLYLSVWIGRSSFPAGSGCNDLLGEVVNYVAFADVRWSMAINHHKTIIIQLSPKFLESQPKLSHTALH